MKINQAFLLLFGSATTTTVVVVNGQEMPMGRYTPFCNVEDDAAVNNLGYTANTWNFFSAEIEGFDYETIAADQPDAIPEIDTFLDGPTFDDNLEQWDCWINHYGYYDWSDFENDPDPEFLGAWEALGWNETSWNEEIDPPASNDKAWAELTMAEQEAAEYLCYLEYTWDGTSLINEFECDDDGGGGGGGGRCFSSANTVDVLGKGSIPMDQLKIGDSVLAGNHQYSRVYSFSHYAPNSMGDYLQIYTTAAAAAASQKDPVIEISEEHMLLVNDEMKRASKVQLGDILGGSHQVVTKIDSVQRRGLYAPVTESGDIMVNDNVLASSYIEIFDETPIHQPTLIHVFMAYHRAVCGVNFDICKQERYTEDGYSYWIYTMMNVVDKLNTDYSTWFHVAGILLVSPLLSFGVVLEQMVKAPFLSSLLAFVGGFLYYQKKMAAGGGKKMKMA